MRDDIKSSCAKRLNRIEGQVRGIARMVEEDRYCIDIVTQVAAVRAALRRVEEEILRDHVAHCVEHAIVSGDNQASTKAAAARFRPRHDLQGRAPETEADSIGVNGRPSLCGHAERHNGRSETGQ